MTTRKPGVGTVPRGRAAPLLGGARLVVDQHGDALDLGEFLLGLDESTAIPHLDAWGKSARRVAVRVVAGDDDPPHALDEEQVGEVGHRHLALRILAAGHRDRTVVEQLVGDVDAGRHRRPHGERPGVEERAVAEVLDEVVAFDERRDADPLCAFAAHLRQADDVADALGVHECDHRVTADAATDERARLGAVCWRCVGSPSSRRASG